MNAIDPITGLPVQSMTNVPPALSNTLGQAKPVFNPQVQQSAQGMFGTQQAMQNAVGASAVFMAPLKSKEHPGKDGHTGHVKDPKGGEIVKVYDDSKPKRKISKKETPKQKENKRVANLLNAKSSKELNK